MDAPRDLGRWSKAGARRSALRAGPGFCSVGRMNFRLNLSLMTALVLAACNDGGGEGDATASETGADTETGDTPATEVELDDFFTQAEAAYCEWQVGCHAFGAEERCRNVNHFEDRLSMRRLSGVGSADWLPTAYYKEAVEVGRIDYDKEAAATCLAYVRAQSCDLPEVHVYSEDELAGQAACAGLFTGRMGKNGPCLSAIECAEAAVCGFDPTCVDMCCVGACRVLPTVPKLGEPCTNSCEGDSFCAFDPNTGTPTVCTASPALGQPCPQFSCAGGSSCEFTGGDTPVCVGVKPVGAACGGDGGNCDVGLVCTRDQNYDNGVCLRPADEGESCDRFSPDIVCRRFDNVCDATDKCAALPGKGETCEDYRCRGDFFCAVGNGTQKCSPVADAGEGCGYPNYDGSYVPCSGDNVCDPNDDFSVYTCVTPNPASPCPVPEDG